jgi:hypothetical protein
VLATYMAQCCGLQMEFQNFHLVSSAPIPSDRRINLSFVLAGSEPSRISSERSATHCDD